MVVYWEGIAQAFPVKVAGQGAGANNPGLASASGFSPIVQPQPVISTLLQEYPLIEPGYQNLAGQIVFQTSFGQYSFSKNLPFMSFTYRDGTPLVAHSLFYVNSTFPTPILLTGYTIDMSYLDSHHFRYSANLLMAGSQVGTLQVSFIFDRVQRPKITVHVNPSATLTAHGFNVLWIVHSVKTFAKFREAPTGLNFMNYTTITPTAFNETSLELGLDDHPETWRLSARRLE